MSIVTKIVAFIYLSGTRITGMEKSLVFGKGVSLQLREKGFSS